MRAPKGGGEKNGKTQKTKVKSRNASFKGGIPRNEKKTIYRG